MRTTILTAYIAFAFTSMNIPCFAQNTGLSGDKKYGSPKRFEKDIRCFETSDRKHAPPKGAIVCIGSSSMRGWHKTIKEDCKHLPSVLQKSAQGIPGMSHLLLIDKTQYRTVESVVDNEGGQQSHRCRMHKRQASYLCGYCFRHAK